MSQGVGVTDPPPPPVGLLMPLRDRLLARSNQLLVELVLALLGYSGLHEVEIEKSFENIKIPFGFAWFHVDDLACMGALHGMGGDIADHAYSMQALGDVGRNMARSDHFFDLVV